MQQLGLGGAFAALLDAGGPLNHLLAQLLLAGEPLFGGVLPPGEWAAAAALLDDHQARREFTKLLHSG